MQAAPTVLIEPELLHYCTKCIWVTDNDCLSFASVAPLNFTSTDVAFKGATEASERQQQCVIAKISAKTKVKNKGNKVIFLTFSLPKRN